jgi:hypothetical protein
MEMDNKRLLLFLLLKCEMQMLFSVVSECFPFVLHMTFSPQVDLDDSIFGVSFYEVILDWRKHIANNKQSNEIQSTCYHAKER